MSNIVEEIVDAAKAKIETLLPDFKELFYATELELNQCGKLDNRYGFLPEGASFLTGKSMGFVTMEQTFQAIVTDEAQNKDSDAALQLKTNKLFEKAHEIVRCFQSQKLILATPTNCVLLVSGSSLEKPGFLNDNTSVVIRINFSIQYRFKACHL